jgi:hypothetical protein
MMRRSAHRCERPDSTICAMQRVVSVPYSIIESLMPFSTLVQQVAVVGWT